MEPRLYQYFCAGIGQQQHHFCSESEKDKASGWSLLLTGLVSVRWVFFSASQHCWLGDRKHNSVRKNHFPEVIFRNKRRKPANPCYARCCDSLQVTELWKRHDFALAYSWIHNILRSVVPLCIMCTLNCFIVNALRRSSRHLAVSRRTSNTLLDRTGRLARERVGAASRDDSWIDHAVSKGTSNNAPWGSRLGFAARLTSFRTSNPLLDRTGFAVPCVQDV